MAVEIEIELDASQATGQIGALSSALSTLEQRVDGFDGDFDNLDFSSITEELQNFADALNEIDVKSSNVADDLKEAAEMISEAEVEHTVNRPDGETGSGDSSGNDPPEQTVNVTVESGFEEAAKKVAPDGGGSDVNLNGIKSKVESLYGFDSGSVEIATGLDNDKLDQMASDIYHTAQDVRSPIPGDLFGDDIAVGGNKGAHNLAENAMPADFHNAKAGVLVDTPAGKMTLADAVRYKQGDFDPEANKAADDDLGGGPSEFVTQMAESAAQAKFDAFKDADEDPLGGGEDMSELRKEELSAGEIQDLYEEIENTTSEFEDLRNVQQRFVDTMAQSAAKAKYDAFKGADGDPLGGGDALSSLRDSELSGSELYDIYSNQMSPGGMNELAPQERDDPMTRGELQSKMQSLTGANGDFMQSVGDIEDLYKTLDRPETNLGRYDSAFGRTGISRAKLMPNNAGFGTETKNMSDKRKELLTDEELAAIEEQQSGLKKDSDSLFDKLTEGSAADTISKIAEKFDGLGGVVRGLMPTMGKYMQLLAALLPMMVTLGVQALGLAAAFGAVGAAGASILGLGLLGHAESMSGAMKQAKLQVREFKKELFEVFQPTMQRFAPIQSQMMDMAPGQLRGVADAMKGLTAYKGTIYQLFSTGANLAEKFVKMMVRNQETISALATAFTEIIGSGILKFLQWLINTTWQNKELMMQLAYALQQVGEIAWSVAMFVSRMVSSFSFLLGIVSVLAGYLNSKLVVGLAVAATTMLGLAFALTKVASAFVLVQSVFAGGIISTMVGGIATAVSALYSYVAAAWSAVGATGALVTWLSALTLGGFALAAGIMGTAAMSHMGGTPPSQGGKQVYNDNRQYTIKTEGKMDNSAEQRIRDEIARQDSRKKATKAPQPAKMGTSTTKGSK